MCKRSWHEKLLETSFPGFFAPLLPRQIAAKRPPRPISQPMPPRPKNPRPLSLPSPPPSRSQALAPPPLPTSGSSHRPPPPPPDSSPLHSRHLIHRLPSGRRRSPSSTRLPPSSSSRRHAVEGAHPTPNRSASHPPSSNPHLAGGCPARSSSPLLQDAPP